MLHSAARRGHLRCVQELIDVGADVQQQAQNGWTPLRSARANGHTAIVNLLIRKGALKERDDFPGAQFVPLQERPYDRKAINADRWLEQPTRADKEPKPGDPDFTIEHVNTRRAARTVRLAKRDDELLQMFRPQSPDKNQERKWDKHDAEMKKLLKKVWPKRNREAGR